MDREERPRAHRPAWHACKVPLSPSPGKDAYFFPALGKKVPFNGLSKCKAKLEERAGGLDWTLHDLRRTFASGPTARGVALPVIERLLNHISGSFGGIVGVYQRYDFMPVMRDAIEQWEAHIRLLVGLPTDYPNVAYCGGVFSRYGKPSLIAGFCPQNCALKPPGRAERS